MIERESIQIEINEISERENEDRIQIDHLSKREKRIESERKRKREEKMKNEMKIQIEIISHENLREERNDHHDDLMKLKREIDYLDRENEDLSLKNQDLRNQIEIIKDHDLREKDREIKSLRDHQLKRENQIQDQIKNLNLLHEIKLNQKEEEIKDRIQIESYLRESRDDLINLFELILEDYQSRNSDNRFQDEIKKIESLIDQIK